MAMLVGGVGAAVLGLVIVVMEGTDDFPGWGTLILCMLVASIPMAIIAALLPPPWGLIPGAVIGALAGGIALSWRWGMSFRRASIAMGIWLASQIVLGLLMDYAAS